MESKFLTDLIIKNLETDEQSWELLSILSYQSLLYNGIITVPSGFVTDLASTGIFRKRCHRESITHDYCYQTHIVSKKLADKIFLEAMNSRKKPFYIRWTYYIAVKLFGFNAYRTGKERFTVLNSK